MSHSAESQVEPIQFMRETSVGRRRSPFVVDEASLASQRKALARL